MVYRDIASVTMLAKQIDINITIEEPEEPFTSDKYKSLNDIPFLSERYNLMYDYWKIIGKLPDDEIRNVINLLYPYIDYEDYKIRNMFFDNSHELRKSYIHSNNFTDFPESSYHWLKSTSKHKKDVIFGTYWTQDILYRHQNPESCEGKTFYLLPDWSSGFGSCIHQIAYLMRYALTKSYIVAYNPKTNYYWASPGEYCKDSKNYDCYFMPLTKCKINISDSSQKHVYGSINDKMDAKNPQFSDEAARASPIPNNYFLDYWMMQCTAYIMRPNARLLDYFEMVENASFSNLQHNDISIHVRLSDKGSEMKLISQYQYHEVLNIVKKYLGKKSLNLFVSSEIEGVISYFKNATGYKLSSMNYNRVSFSSIISLHSTDMALISLANLKAAVEADITIGTWNSNWYRLIIELRNTVGYKSNHLNFEIGDRECISSPHCKLLMSNIY